MTSNNPAFMDPEEAAWALTQAGWATEAIPTMIAIGLATSNLRVDYRYTEAPPRWSYGWLQLDQDHGFNPERLLKDPVYTASSALYLYNQQGFAYWGQFRNDGYQQWMIAAQAAAISPRPYRNQPILLDTQIPNPSEYDQEYSQNIDLSCLSVQRQYSGYPDRGATVAQSWSHGWWIYRPGGPDPRWLMAPDRNTLRFIRTEDGDIRTACQFDLGNDCYWIADGAYLKYWVDDVSRNPLPEGTEVGFCAVPGNDETTCLPPRPVVTQPLGGVGFQVDAFLGGTIDLVGVTRPQPLARASAAAVRGYGDWVKKVYAHDPSAAPSYDLRFELRDPADADATGIVSWGHLYGYPRPSQIIDVSLAAEMNQPPPGRAFTQPWWLGAVPEGWRELNQVTAPDLDWDRLHDGYQFFTGANALQMYREPIQGYPLPANEPGFADALPHPLRVRFTSGSAKFDMRTHWMRTARLMPLRTGGATLAVEQAAADAGHSDSPDKTWYDPTAFLVALDGAASLAEVLAAFNSTVGAFYDVTLRTSTAVKFPGYSYRLLSAGDLAQAKLTTQGIGVALCHYRQAYVTSLKFDHVSLVKGIAGTASSSLTKVVALSSAPEQCYDVDAIQDFAQAVHTLHHELMHIAAASDPATWTTPGDGAWLAANPTDYRVGGGTDTNNTPVGFPSNYAMTNLDEDIAEVMTMLWEPNSTLFGRLTTDAALNTKVQIMVKWLNSRAMTTFNTLVGFDATAVTLRLPAVTKDASLFGFRFGDGEGSAEDMWNGRGNLHLNADGRSVTKTVYPGQYMAVAHGITADNTDIVYYATYTVGLHPPDPTPPPAPSRYGALDATATGVAVHFS